MADWSRTVHGIGDLHAGGIKRPRVATMLDDVKTLPTPALHLQAGDSTEHGLPKEDVLALRWLGRLPADAYAILGNHDILHNRRRAMEWAREYGYKSHNYVIDLPFLRIVAVSPDRDHPKDRAGTLSATTLSWLEQRLKRAGGRDCWIACHWPLHKTVMGDSKKVYTSAMQGFYAKPSTQIRALLARNPNAKAWISGHTHSPLNAPHLITRAKLPRDRKIVAINLSALVGVGKVREPQDPICSVYLTHLPGKIEVRFRDHRARAWKPVFRGNNVQTIPSEGAFEPRPGCPTFRPAASGSQRNSSSAIFSAGFIQPRVSRGLRLSCAATWSSSTWPCTAKSVLLGKYCRSSPLVFSFEPRCQGECGSQK